MQDKKCFITCSCGCGDSVLFRADEELYISFLSNDFYRYQGFGDRMRLTAQCLTGNYTLVDILITEDDLESLAKFLDDVNITDSPDHKNDASMDVIDTFMPDFGMEQLSINLTCNMSKKDLFCGKIYRCFDLTYNKEQTEDLRKAVHKLINSAR